MNTEEINMEQDLSPREASIALGVSTRTVNNWLNDGTLAFYLDFKERRRIQVSELFRFAKSRGLEGGPAEKKMIARLLTDILPKYGQSSAQNSSTNVLNLV